MNTKKLIGMIIGVALFAALIAGATFAWLTYTAVVQNASKTITTRNFTFTSPTGTDITKFPTIANQPARNNTFSAGNGYVVLALSKAADTPYASSVKIVLSKTTNGITLANALRYAVCRSATASQCNNSVSTAIPSTANNSNWVVTNNAVGLGTGDQVLWEDTASAIGTSSTSSPFKSTGAASTSYYVYFWLDPAIITTANSSQVMGKEFLGHIYFEATQGE